MITARFSRENGHITAFSISGHSGLAEAGSDILCAAVSSMSTLVANTLTEVFGAEADIKADERIPLFSLSLKSLNPENEDAIFGVLRGFYLQLEDLSRQYPDNLKITD